MLSKGYKAYLEVSKSHANRLKPSDHEQAAQAAAEQAKLDELEAPE